MKPTRSRPSPLYVRALDAFEAFYRQLGVISQRAAELRASFASDSLASVVLAAADLNSALGVLYARLELLEVVTNDDAGRDLWAHPMMELMRSQLRAVLEDGTAYASGHLEGWRVRQQLRHLAVTLAAEAKVAKEIIGAAPAPDGDPGNIIVAHPEPGQRIAVTIARSGAGRLTRCRMRRPWRRAWRPERRRDLP